MPLTRRRFLGIAGAASCVLLLWGCGALPKAKRTPPPADDGVDLGMPEVPSDQLPDGAQFALDRAKPLAEADSPVLTRIVRDGMPTLPVLIYRTEAGALAAFVAECPDFGGPLLPRRTGFKKYWQARRHGSRFVWDGSHTMRGPAKSALRRLLVFESNGMVVVRDCAP